MKKEFQYILLFAFLTIGSACQPMLDEEDDIHIRLSNDLDYSFLICGHTYGDPDNWVDGLYPEFVSFFPFINEYPKMSLGLFVGDVIPKDEDYRWDFALQDMAKLNFPTYIAPGNHDLGFNIFYDRFGYFYKSFFWKDDLYIILTPNLDYWNISGQQLDFLVNTLKYEVPKARNIFVLHHEDNIHFIATGMGAGINDNFVIAEVKENGDVDFKLCAMQGEMNRLGDLEDYELPEGKTF